MSGLKREFPFDLAGVTVAISAVAAIYGGIRAFYYGGGFLESFSYFSNETQFNEIANSWIDRDPQTTLFGVHAFGDYVLANVWSQFPDPWVQLEQVNYLPPILLLYRVLDLFPYQIGFTLYFALLILGTLTPMVIASRGWSMGARLLLIVTLGLMTGPALATLDRGNSQGLLPIILFGFALAVLRKRWGWAALLISLAAAIKIYPVVLILMLLALRRYRWALASIGLSALWLVLSLPIMASGGFGSLPALIADVLQWQERTTNDFLMYNVSFAGGVANFLVFIGLDGLGLWVATHPIVLIAAYGLIVVPLLWVSRIPLWMRLILTLSLTTALMPITYPYALNWALAASALVVLVSRSGVRELTPRNAQIGLILALAVVISVLPVLIPGTMEAGRPAGVVSLAAMVSAIILPITAWMSRTPQSHLDAPSPVSP